MRNRQLSLFLSALLALGALQATPVTRTAPFANIRSVTCALVESRRQREFASLEEQPRIVWSEQSLPTLHPAHQSRHSPWLESAFRFQLPPPAIAG